MTATTRTPRTIDGPALTRALPPGDAVEALRHALASGLDVSATPPRSKVPLDAGELLLMPAEHGGYAGVKITGVAPDNPARGLPRITGSYLLLEGATLRPLALLDGETLTLLRTSAVSALAVDCLATPDSARLAVFGTGPQALAHAVAVHQVRPLTSVHIVGRTPENARSLAERCRETGIPAAVADAGTALAEADIVACCTSASSPLFDGSALQPHATVVAMGSHSPHDREVDTATVRRSTVVVEDVDTARREAGDVVVPLAEGALAEDRLITLQDLVRDPGQVAGDRPRLFKSVGMAWQDVVLAAAAHRGARGEDGNGNGQVTSAGAG
ncbi:ornithine cyclodeaminase family protein [Streptomyces sp. ODS28]|uniref:ornithine cyclodeaminase family protein n=1 Tax=Streptomyces sp. ODS28 TaxID=3136688 RepID=UPI0031E6FDF7